MHPLNTYATSPPDYAVLARHDEALAAFVRSNADGGVSIDHRDPDAVRALTEATLRVDFGVHAKLRKDRLCPPIPNRLNYIAWVDELLRATEVDLLLRIKAAAVSGDNDGCQCSKRTKKTSSMRSEEIRILDIGTGACCIYALLGCSLHSNWHFTATDIDEESIVHAQAIVSDSRNNVEAGAASQTRARFAPADDQPLTLRQRIQLVKRTKSAPLLSDLIQAAAQTSDAADQTAFNPAFHVTMCNPPFYASQAEMAASAAGKALPPSAITQGSVDEMIYADGGEVAFVGRMIDESIIVGQHVLWFTSMLGKQSSLAPLVTKLRRHGVDNYLITEFVQGSKTRRWALAWSFTPFRIAEPYVPTPSSLHYLAPARLYYDFPRSWQDNESSQLMMAATALRQYLTDKGIASLSDAGEQSHFTASQLAKGVENAPDHSFIAYACGDSWTRKARRRKQGQNNDKSASDAPALVVRLRLTAYDNRINVRASWAYGREHRLLESFVLSLVREWCAESM